MVDNDDEEIESGKDRSEVSCPTGCCERMATSTHTSLSPITRKSLRCSSEPVNFSHPHPIFSSLRSALKGESTVHSHWIATEWNGVSWEFGYRNRYEDDNDSSFCD